MNLKILTDQEKDIILQCLTAAFEGSFFPEWEFQNLFGVERNMLEKIIKMWPIVDESDKDICLAIHNSMGNLVGYPHGNEKEWKKYISVGTDEVIKILKKCSEPPRVFSGDSII